MLILYIFCPIPGISHFLKHSCPVIRKGYSEITIWVHCFYFPKLKSKLKSRTSRSNFNFRSHAGECSESTRDYLRVPFFF